MLARLRHPGPVERNATATLRVLFQRLAAIFDPSAGPMRILAPIWARLLFVAGGTILAFWLLTRLLED